MEICMIHSRPLSTIITIKSRCEDFKKFIWYIYSNKKVILSPINILCPWSFPVIFITFHSSILSSPFILFCLNISSESKIFQSFSLRSVMTSPSFLISLISPISLHCSGLLQLVYVLIILSYPVYRIRNIWIEWSIPDTYKRDQPSIMIPSIAPRTFFRL